MTVSKGPQVFPRTEYLRRLAAVKAEMVKRDIETLVVTFDRSINYLTGYTARSAYVPQALVVSVHEEEPPLILRLMDVPAGIHLTFLERNKIIGYPESLVGNPEKDGFDAVIDFLQEAKLTDRGVGLEMGQLPARAAENFKKRLPGARFVDCTHVVTWIRVIKSDLEIALMKEAAAIADAGMMRAAEVIRPGVHEADAVAEILATLARGANGKHGTGIANIFMCSSPRTGTSHIIWSDDTFREGSQINLELGGVRHTYTAAIMRTFSIGKPSDRLLHLHEAEVQGLEAALEKVRPGATCSDVAEAFNRTIGKSGFQKESRCGYGIGIDWNEAVTSLKEGDMTVLKPNMTFHLMLGNWIDEDFGYVLSETFRVTDSGADVLTRVPRQIFEI
ncbi:MULTISPECIES: Xaa-Pro peptidase family protein [unclassified Bradyrhizobium]|uniref:M24 family metallopeptidase n=1 Tax=unclassified Bradyrhizobium TaxID=2631580 RepID=UPI001FFAE6DC|nr:MULTISPECIES: Xaa-Pro peptidase family protein [unclassified Bradyrhizobium]MCK1420545.1 aminopeptidase P family protein [Bradyrhizobium sp. CW12]MCK1646773.1 aminopeptidase P family protein [Bradyrhizobium sp. 154]